MPQTFDLIATTTLSSTAATISFTSVPQTYTDLRLVVWGTFQVQAASSYIRFNSDAANNYSNTYIRSANSGTTAIGLNDYSTAPYCTVTNTAGSTTSPILSVVDILSYSDTGKFKNIRVEAGELKSAVTGQMTVFANIWKSTSAITSISYGEADGNLLSIGFTASLYGIKAA